MAECVIYAKALLRRLKNVGMKSCIETPQVLKMQNIFGINMWQVVFDNYLKRTKCWNNKDGNISQLTSLTEGDIGDLRCCGVGHFFMRCCGE